MKTRSKSEDHQDFWQRHVGKFNQSGLTQKEYCRQNSIAYWSFNSWCQLSLYCPAGSGGQHTENQGISVTIRTFHYESPVFQAILFCLFPSCSGNPPQTLWRIGFPGKTPQALWRIEFPANSNKPCGESQDRDFKE